MEYRRREVASGLVIIAAVLLLGVMVALSSNVQELFREKKEFTVRFTNAEGVEINTPVKQAGILVGKISNIEVKTFDRQNKIVLTLRVRTETIIKRDSKVMIKSPLVGEKYVDLGLGSPDSPALAQGDMLVGVEGLSLDQLTDTVVNVVEDLQGIVTDIRKITGDPQFQQDIKNSVSNLQEATSELQEILRDNKGNINSAMRDLKEIAAKLTVTAQQLERTTRDLNAVIAENRTNINTTIENLSKTPDQLMAEVEAIQQAITTPLNENREDLKKIMENLEKMTQNLVELTDLLKKDPSRIIRK